MYLIEKCLSKNIASSKNPQENHLWVRAWGLQDKSVINGKGFRDAIHEFHERTSKVKSTPHRLRVVDSSSAVIASINAPDSAAIANLCSNTVRFKPDALATITLTQGAVVAHSGGLLVGGGVDVDKAIEQRVNEIAERLAAFVDHGITTRFNSNGKSGGAFLVTSPCDKWLFANSDVGISFNQNGQYTLTISADFLADSKAEEKTGYYSAHASLDEAIAMLPTIVRHQEAKNV